MPLTLLNAPDDEPVSLDEAKLHLRVDGADDDSLITALITAARQQAENRTGRALVTQKWRYDLATFPVDTVELPKPPLASVESITYLDADGTRQTLTDSAYEVYTASLAGVVNPAYDTAWPACREQPGSVQISYTAGYGDAAAVPQLIKAWMLLAIATWYAQREAVITGTIVSELPSAFWDSLLDAYCIMRFA